MNLRLDWCSHEAAKYACENWHYSKTMPAFKLLKIGVWENEAFIGVIIFSMGNNRNIGSPFGLNQFQICELTRIALNKHVATVSRMVSIALKMLKKNSPNLKMVISYSDMEQDHYGGIYQAGNWIYIGSCAQNQGYKINGKIIKHRSLSSMVGHIDKTKLNAEIIKGKPKHKYLMPLTEEMRKQIEPLRKPYPKKIDA